MKALVAVKRVVVSMMKVRVNADGSGVDIGNGENVDESV